ncbi:hypothetical protein PSU4_20540 [Pseudonocardia sulfidoxydans NBRC 16205]|uniref:Ester cyclase n=1 Tax=Pseudonocardia sulfidoxydans NBRC 16205 TaxID=1223511 RepID=A0A511DE64_9PSEU|nr:ester cyclase [Pseudonocardia sulfidoxydans]GEL23100.1 hypothetical protein PSU4_20540 [Pseudonocardia sulfidoxydans NBRC 16205]
MTTTLETSQAALGTAIDRWNAGDLEGYLRIYDADVLVHGFGPEPLDKAGVRAFYEALTAAFPGSRIELHDTFGSGDRIVSRFTLSGTHDGEFMGVPATGNPIAMNGITILRMRDGVCLERWTSTDLLSVLVQIGAMPAPA